MGYDKGLLAWWQTVSARETARVVDIEMRAQVSNREGDVISRAFEASCSICM